MVSREKSQTLQVPTAIRQCAAMVACVIESQCQLRSSQVEAGIENLPDGCEQHIFYAQNLCIYCLVTRNLKKSSDARATRDFIYADLPKDVILDGHSDKLYIKPDTIQEIFDTHVVSAKAMETSLQQIDEAVEREAIADGLQVSVSLLVKSIVHHQIMEASRRKRILNYELPNGEWLFDAVEEELSPLGFSVTHQCNTNLISYANEYTLCKSDLVIANATKL